MSLQIMQQFMQTCLKDLLIAALVVPFLRTVSTGLGRTLVDLVRRAAHLDLDDDAE